MTKGFYIRNLAVYIAALSLCLWIWIKTGGTAGASLAAFAVIAPLATAATAAAARKKVTAKAELSELSGKGKPVNGVLRVSCESVLPVFRGYAFMEIHNHLTGETAHIALPFSPLEKRSATGFCIRPERCGYVTAGIEKIWLTDIFGIIPVKASDAGFSQGKVSVMPDTFPMNVVFENNFRVPEDSDTYDLYRKGSDYSETFQLRDYVPGDDIRGIHWKLSEKTDRLIVRDPSLPVAKSVLVFWDKGAGMMTPGEADASAEVAATLAGRLCDMGISFFLSWSEGKKAYIRSIDSREKLYGAVPAMIKENGFEEGSFGTDAFAGSIGAPSFGKIIYIGKGVSPTLSLFEGESSLSLILCGDCAGRSGAAVFSAENYASDLSRLEVV